MAQRVQLSERPDLLTFMTNLQEQALLWLPVLRLYVLHMAACVSHPDDEPKFRPLK